MISYPSCFLIAVLLVLMNLRISHSSEGMKLFCGPDGPAIQFPFQLADHNSTDSCHSPILLSCDNNKNTILELPTVPDPVKVIVDFIDYEYRMLNVVVPGYYCLPKLLRKILHSSIYPFQFNLGDTQPSTDITFFDCPSHSLKNECQIMSSCPNIYAAASEQSVVEFDLVSCTKMFNKVLPVAGPEVLNNNFLSLTWSEQVEHFHCKHKPRTIPTSNILAAVGSIALVLVLVASFIIYRYFRMKGEDHARVERFLEDYRALKPTRFSYADVKRITNRFLDKLGEGTHGAVFKGRLSNDIHVAVKILNNTDGDGQEFINEVGTMGKIHHVNAVRLLGFCADGFRRALIYDFFPNGSLQKFLCPPDNNRFLGWDKLQQIAIGIAKGIEYLHHGCDHRILHFDINPNNVLLDNDFIPKITDFGLAKLCSKNQSIVSMTTVKGTLGYIAPEVFSRNFGNVSYKSDIYSYGMLLLEMVGGRKNIDKSAEESFQILYPDWIHNLLEGGDIHIQIDKELEVKIAKKLAVVGLWCIQWHPVDRPSMKSVIQMLEGEVDRLQTPPNPFDSSASTNRRQNLELEVIHELDEIDSARY